MKTTIPVVMMGKPRMTRRDVWLNPPRPAIAKYRILQADIEEFTLKSKYTLPDAFTVDIYLPMSESWSNKRKAALNGTYHQFKPDVDNVLKALMDCMKKNDETVCDVHIRKFWSDQPRVEITELKERYE